MVQMKTGKFIADMRKTQELTQKELAERLGLSDKTISKWECGNGMPDNSIIHVIIKEWRTLSPLFRLFSTTPQDEDSSRKYP